MFTCFPVISNELTNEAIAEASYIHSNERLTFHERCGSLVKLSNNRRTAERRRPLDEFNNGVVMTNRPIKDDELFEVRDNYSFDSSVLSVVQILPFFSFVNNQGFSVI